MAHDKNNVTQEWTPDALSTLNKMRYKCDEIGAVLGYNSDEYAKATMSLVRCLTAIPGFGGTVYKDSEYSLLVAGFMTVGIIFHHRTKEVNGNSFVYGEWSSHS